MLREVRDPEFEDDADAREPIKTEEGELKMLDMSDLAPPLPSSTSTSVNTMNMSSPSTSDIGAGYTSNTIDSFNSYESAEGQQEVGSRSGAKC